MLLNESEVGNGDIKHICELRDKRPEGGSGLCGRIMFGQAVAAAKGCRAGDPADRGQLPAVSRTRPVCDGDWVKRMNLSH